MTADVYLNFFFQPIPAIPVACLYAEGLMKQTGVSANRQFVSDDVLEVASSEERQP